MQNIISGNWKMNLTIKEAKKWFKEFEILNSEADYIVFVPFTHLAALEKVAKSKNIKLGAQNMSDSEYGAYTGEISPLMLDEIGITNVLLGHSERRNIFHETDKLINKKLHLALMHNFRVTLCIGENLEEKEMNQTKTIIHHQLKHGLKDVEKVDNLIIAYEPIWSIGTGESANPDDMVEVFDTIREILIDMFGENANNIPLQYGGSVNAENKNSYLKVNNINGVLVGGASLDPEEFKKI